MKAGDGKPIAERWAEDYAACGEKACMICRLIEELSAAEEQLAEAKRSLVHKDAHYNASLDNLLRMNGRSEERERVLREALEEALPSIEEWAKAYPLTMFPEPDFVRVRELLGDTLLTQVSGANMRHVITKVWEILAPVAALATPAPEPPAKRYRLNSGPCAAMVVDCDCRICRPELEDRPAPCQCALCLAPRAPEPPSEQNGGQ